MAYENVKFTKPNMCVVDGYFFMFDEVNNKVIQKSADSSTIFEYPTSIRLGYKFYEDNFDTNTYDSDLWYLTGTNGGFRDGKFWSKLNSGASSGNTVLASNFRAKGTYDIRIDYNLIYLSTTNWAGAQFQLVNHDVTDTYLQVRRHYNSGHKYYADVKSGGSWTSVGNVTTTDTIGGMRFYRSYNSSTTTVYYKSGITGAWVSMGSTATVGIGSSNNVQVKFFATNGSPYPEVEAEFDNFYMSIVLTEVKSIQYDGVYFWTLQNILGTNEVVIRKWIIQNYTCKLVKEFMYENTTSITYNASAFGIEHYITKLSNDISSGDNLIHIDEYYDSVVTSGTILTLGPNEDDLIEDVVVSSVSGTDIYLDGNLLYDYQNQDNVNLSKSLFLFNNYYGKSSVSGSLLRYDSNDGSFLYSDPKIDYKSVTAATFASLKNVLRDKDQTIYDVVDDAYSLIYVKGTSAKFRNLSDFSNIIEANSANDDFTGNDYSLPNRDKWEITIGAPIIYNNSLWCKPEIDSLDEIKSKYTVGPDFEVQVSGTFDAVVSSMSGSISNVDQYLSIDDAVYPYKIGISYQEHVGILFNDDFSAGGGKWYIVTGTAAFVDGALKQTTDGCQVRTTDSYSFGTEWEFTCRFRHYGYGSINDQYHISPIWVNDSNRVTVRLRIYSSPGNVVFSKVVSGSETVLFTSTKYNYYNYRGTWFWFTVKRSGNVSYFKIWMDGTEEPSSWDYITSAPTQVSNFPTSGYIMAHSMFTDSNGSWLDDVYVTDSTVVGGSNVYLYTELGGVKEYHNVLSTDTLYPEVHYMFKINKSSDVLSVSHRITTTGILPSEWEYLENVTVAPFVNTLSLGVRSGGATISGAYFDDLVYNDGSIQYPSTDISYYGIMNMDNIKADNVTVIPIYSINYYGGDLYRLQKDATYYGSNNTWATYNYVVSPVRSFIDAITMTANPVIIPADGRNISTLTCTVMDQYGNGSVNAPITFTDNDAYGYVTINPKYTDYYYGDGEAISYYRSGVDIHTVTITATATQYD